MSTIYEPQGRAREYSPLALNFFKGCTHGCIYCYVPSMFKRFNAQYNHENCFSALDIKKLEQSARRMQGCGKQILLSFTGDPYCGVDDSATETVLKILNQYGHKVAILTKGGKRCLKHLSLFKEFVNRIKIGATLTFDNDEMSKGWEPGAAMPSDRIAALKELAENGIKTWVSFEPVIYPEQSLRLLSAVAKIVDHVKIGKINNFRGWDKKIDWNDFLKKAVQICRAAELPFYIKADLRQFADGVELSENEKNMDFLNL